MYILKEIAYKKDEIEANDRLLKFCVTFGKPGTVIVFAVRNGAMPLVHAVVEVTDSYRRNVRPSCFGQPRDWQYLLELFLHYVQLHSTYKYSIKLRWLLRAGQSLRQLRAC